MDRGIPTEATLAHMRASTPPVRYLVGTPKGRLFPLSRDELVECAALLDSVAMRMRLLLIFGSLILVIAAFQTWYFPSRQVAQAREDLLVKARTTTRLLVLTLGGAAGVLVILP